MKTDKFSKLTAIVLAVVLVLGLLPMAAMAADPVSYNPGDVAAINAMLTNSNLGWTQGAPASWAGVTWSSEGRVTRLTLGNMTLSGNVDLTGLTALNQTTLTGDISLAGYTLKMRGECVQTGGSLIPNNGRLEIDGDFKQTGGYTSITMNNQNAYMLVGGNFEVCSIGNTFNNGTLEIKGNFAQVGNNGFNASGNHTTMFTGGQPHIVSFGNPVWQGFAILYYNRNTIFLNDNYRFVEKHLFCVHEYDDGDVTTPATCITKGVKRFTCECGDSYTEEIAIDPDNHAGFVAGIPVLPTCTEQGYTTYTCECLNSYDDDEVDALGHNWDEGDTTDPTCTELGYTTYTCLRCGDNYVDEDSYVTALGHDFTVETTHQDATCTESGYTVFKCIRCIATDTVSIPAKGHIHTAVIIPPTCTEQGYTTYTCVCSDRYESDYIAALDHDWDEGTVTEEPTEDEDGEMTYVCQRCYATRTEPIPANGHNHEYAQTVTPPTCTEQGYTTYTCGCGVTYDGGYTAALGHDFTVETAHQDATCTESGYTVFECSRCDATDTVYIPATGIHDWDEGSATDPTCTEQGYTTYICSVCRSSYIDNETGALGHDYDYTTPISHMDATCIDEGYDTFKCIRCEETDTVSISTAGHDYTAVTTPPTCTGSGCTTYTCSVCGDKYTETIEALGHDWQKTETIPPTETEYGYTVYECSICGAEKHDDFTDPTGTGQSDAEVLKDAAAGILKNGLTADQLVLAGKELVLVIDGREFVLSTNANNRNVSGEIDLGDGYYLVYDIKGNGSNIKEFKIIQK